MNNNGSLIMKKALPYVVIVLASFLAALPLLIFTDVKHMHDNMVHYSAINALNQAWQDGHFGTRIYTIISQDYGYPIGLFYSMLPASITVIIINVLNVSVSTALFIQFFSLFTISGLITYFFLKRVFKDTKLWIILFATCVYILFPYTLCNLYVRFAFSEIHLVLSMPLIAWGMFELFVKDNYKAFFPLFICGGLVALFFHFTLFIYICIFVVFFALLNYKKLFKKHLYIPLGIASIIVLLIGATFWYPMLINLNDSYASALARSPWKLMLIAGLNFWPFRFVFINIIFASILFTIYLIICLRNKGSLIKKSPVHRNFFIVTCVTFVMLTPFFPWFLIPSPLYMLQFAFRMLSFFSILSAVIVVIILKNIELRNNSKFFVYIVALVVGLSFFSQALISGPYPINSLADKETFLSSSAGVGTRSKKNPAMDYYPKTLQDVNYVFTRANGKMVIPAGDIDVWEFANYQSLNQISFVVHNIEQESFVVLNLKSKLFDEDVHLTGFTFNANLDKTSPGAGKTVTEQIAIDQTGEFIEISIPPMETSLKLIINYTPGSKMAMHLKTNPFEFLSLDPDSDWDKVGGSYATEFVKTGVDYSVRFENVTQEVTVELPTFYFKGYELTYLTDSGEILKIASSQSDNGFIKVTVNTSGKLSVVYTGGNYLKIGNTISIVGLGFLVASMIGVFTYPVVKRRLNKQH